ncbi:MAG: hypothetical protein V1790_00600 [Planctomycetota bacterium]
MCMAALAAGELGHATPLAAAAVVLWSAVSIPRADGGGDLSQFKDRVQALHDRVVELAGENDLLDTLYFGWSDRPYARATLAILVKVAATLDREMDCRGHGNGKIDDATVESMLHWAHDAIQRAVHAEPTDDFRAHRMRITWEQLVKRDGVPPLFAFSDSLRTTPDCEFLGDSDLLACLGQRVYPWSLVRPTEWSGVAGPGRRAEALGMLALDVLPDLPPGWRLSGLFWEDWRSTWEESRRFVAGLPLAALISGNAAVIRELFALPAVMDASDGEPLADALARRATVRGAFASSKYAVDRWVPPVLHSTGQKRLPEVSAGMWVEALDGQCLAIIGGWLDLPEGEQPPVTSILLDPSLVETIAHNALDLLRHRDHLRAFEGGAQIAFVVGRDAIAFEEPASDEESGMDAWAEWVKPIWSELVARQTRFDVVNRDTPPEETNKRYRVVIPLERPGEGKTASLIEKIERRLAQDSEHVYRLTTREMDGTIARDMFVRVGRTPEGKACAGIVNLSDRARVLKLRGRPAIGPSRDVISNQQIPEPDQRLKFEPWQVRLLWPPA